jgi:radical SAM protein with 4Fe4S-binding SPASM domain
MIGYYDKQYKFREIFNPETGFYLRTGILKQDPQSKKYIDTGIDPFMRSMPSLIDIGIMGECIHGRRRLCILSGVECYQNGLNIKQNNMSLPDFKRIIDEIRGSTFQCALGGRGDPNKHEHFEEILCYSRENSIVPNYTTSGLELTDKEIRATAKYVGAVAVSFYRHKYTFEALNKFIAQGVKTNIHYVLSKNSIAEAIDRLENKGFPENINAIIFLLHKPAGLGTQSNVLHTDDKRLKRFFSLIVSVRFPFKIGFDSCSVPGLLNYADQIDRKTIDPCEGGRFSCYIGPDLKMTPCSFDQKMKYSVDLKQYMIKDAWSSKAFESFRSVLKHSCPECSDRNDCMGGCPLMPEITLCKNKTNNLPKQEEK